MSSVEDNDTAIAVRGLVKRFGTLTAVNDVSFTVRRGEVFGVLGPNAAGKTTTLECIEGLQAPTSGDIEVLGLDVRRDTARVKERIGVQLQASAYFDYLTLREILALFGRFYSRRIAPDDLLAKVRLLDKADATVRKLSGGQKQRFTIAAALVNDAEVLFLDEPTTGLDPQARRDLWASIQGFHAEGRTVVLTTHYMEEAQALCQRVAIMDRGVIVGLDTPANLIRSLPAPFEVKGVADGRVPAEVLESLAGVISVRHDDDGAFSLRSADTSSTLPALIEWMSQAGVRLTHLEVVQATLEDVFLAFTGRELQGDGTEEAGS